mgnify:CR=1 FL=1
MVALPAKAALDTKLPAASIVPALTGVTLHVPPATPPFCAYADAVPAQISLSPLTVMVGQPGIQFTTKSMLPEQPLASVPTMVWLPLATFANGEVPATPSKVKVVGLPLTVTTVTVAVAPVQFWVTSICGNALTVTLKLAVVAQVPASGVKVYVPLLVLLTKAGDHVPLMPLVEVLGNIGAVLPLQIAAMAAKVGTVG